MTYSVVIPTYNRPTCIERNLRTLAAQPPPPGDVVIVDASTDERTREVVERFRQGDAGVAFELVLIENPDGRGNTPLSRNKGIAAARAEIVAFLDDDAFPHAGWATAILETFADMPDVSGLAGRALNGVPGEAHTGVDRIGRINRDGTLTGNFAADPGRIVDVDHAIGCNMALRRSFIESMGGFRDDFRPGPFGICEETEIFFRGKRAGYRFVFVPAMAADHIGAQQPGSRRFGLKYSYYHARNNLVMVGRNAGPAASLRHVAAIVLQEGRNTVARVSGALLRFIVTLGGLVSGVWHSLVHRRTR